jgi:hypothetical protein
LISEKRKVDTENKKLRGETTILREEIEKTKDHEQSLDMNGKTGKGGKLLGESVVLSELSANTMDRTANGSRSKQEREDKNSDYLNGVLERRIKIQEERHRTISVLTTLLADI